MDHSKRSSESLESSREKKLCQHSFEDVQETAEHAMLLQESREETNLSLLPNEILLKIFSHLSPADLISIVQLNDNRLAELTYTLRHANFSLCRSADPVLVSSFFSRERASLIQKLNFNYYFYLKPHELTNLICRCKNLKSLSVVGCKLNYTNIYQILKSCKQLEVLAWNIGPSYKSKLTVYGFSSNLKKLYLFREYLSSRELLNTIALIQKVFHSVKQVWVDFDYDCNSSSLPFVGMWSMVSSVSNEENSKHLLIMANKVMYKGLSTTSIIFKYACEEMIEHMFDRRRYIDPFYPDSPSNVIVNFPPYLQFRSEIGDLQSVSSSPSKAYSTIVINMTDELLEVSESLIKCVREIAGEKLKRLSFLVHNFKKLGKEFVWIKDPEYVSICDKTCDVMEQIVLTSKYITLLNLTTVHFSTSSPTEAITHLKYLRVLNLPSCAFRSKKRTNDSENLSSIVSACARIEEFALYFCSQGIITSDDIVCIQNWLWLKHLSVFYSIYLRSFAFLQKVADSCIQLSSLTLIALPSSAVGLFTNDVIYLLKKARNLRFIRINDAKFNPNFERFWPAIGEAVNLEGICITTKSSAFVPTKLVLDGIKKLKYLHLFHFHANVASRLGMDVKKSMQGHGIQNIKFENECILSNNVETHHAVSLYHRRPYISECSRQHLKDVDI